MARLGQFISFKDNYLNQEEDHDIRERREGALGKDPLVLRVLCSVHMLYRY